MSNQAHHEIAWATPAEMGLETHLEAVKILDTPFLDTLSSSSNPAGRPSPTRQNEIVKPEANLRFVLIATGDMFHKKRGSIMRKLVKLLLTHRHVVRLFVDPLLGCKFPEQDLEQGLGKSKNQPFRFLGLGNWLSLVFRTWLCRKLPASFVEGLVTWRAAVDVKAAFKESHKAAPSEVDGR